MIGLAVQFFLRSEKGGCGDEDTEGSKNSIRDIAAEALLKTGVRQVESVRLILPFMQSEDLKLRLQAAGMLAAGGQKIEQAVELAEEGLDVAEPRIRCLAAEVITRLADHAHSALPALLSHLGEQDGYASSAIKKAIVAIGPVGIPMIVEVLKHDPNAQVRARCASILAGKGAEPAFDALHAAALNDSSDDVRFRATRALVRIKRGENPAYLESILVNAEHNENGSYRWRAGEISQMGTYLPQLWKCLVSSDEKIRQPTIELVKRFQLHRHRSVARHWVRGSAAGEIGWLVNGDEQVLSRRLEALFLLDKHLHFHEDFLRECALHEDQKIGALAKQLIHQLESAD